MIFIDTGAFLARYISSDQHHGRAAWAWDWLRENRERCLTSNFVLDEAFTLLARRAGYPFAAQRARNMLASEVLEVLRPEERQEREAVDLFEKFADQKVSFTDCVSFALMRQQKLRRAFTFDRHFERAGFEVWPGAA